MAFLNRPDKFLFYNKGPHKIFDACTCTKVAGNLNSRLLKLNNTRILQIHPKISSAEAGGRLLPPPLLSSRWNEPRPKPRLVRGLPSMGWALLIVPAPQAIKQTCLLRRENLLVNNWPLNFQPKTLKFLCRVIKISRHGKFNRVAGRQS